MIILGCLWWYHYLRKHPYIYISIYIYIYYIQRFEIDKQSDISPRSSRSDDVLDSQYIFFWPQELRSNIFICGSHRRMSMVSTMAPWTSGPQMHLPTIYVHYVINLAVLLEPQILNHSNKNQNDRWFVLPTVPASNLQFLQATKPPKSDASNPTVDGRNPAPVDR